MGPRLQHRTPAPSARDGGASGPVPSRAGGKGPLVCPVYSEEDQNGQWVLRRVGSNGVVSVDNQMFSVGNACKAQLVDAFVDDTTIQVWHQNHLIKTVARLRKGPVRKIRADGLHVNDQAEPKRKRSAGA